MTKYPTEVIGNILKFTPANDWLKETLTLSHILPSIFLQFYPFQKFKNSVWKKFKKVDDVNVIMKNITQKFISDKNYKLVYQMCRLNMTDAIKHMVKYKNIKLQHHMLWIACKFGHESLVNFILKSKKIDPSRIVANGTIYITAVEEGYLNIVKMLLDDGRVSGKDFQSFGFRLACENGHSDIVKLLLATGDIDPLNNYGYWYGDSLKSSIWSEQIKIIVILLNYIKKQNKKPNREHLNLLNDQTVRGVQNFEIKRLICDAMGISIIKVSV